MPANINIHHRIIPAIRIQICPMNIPLRKVQNLRLVRIKEPAVNWVVEAALQVVEACVYVVHIPAVEEEGLRTRDSHAPIKLSPTVYVGMP